MLCDAKSYEERVVFPFETLAGRDYHSSFSSFKKKIVVFLFIIIITALKVAKSFVLNPPLTSPLQASVFIERRWEGVGEQTRGFQLAFLEMPSKRDIGSNYR